jgi:hypothetical protein
MFATYLLRAIRRGRQVAPGMGETRLRPGGLERLEFDVRTTVWLQAAAAEGQPAATPLVVSCPKSVRNVVRTRDLPIRLVVAERLSRISLIAGQLGPIFRRGCGPVVRVPVVTGPSKGFKGFLFGIVQFIPVQGVPSAYVCDGANAAGLWGERSHGTSGRCAGCVVPGSDIWRRRGIRLGRRRCRSRRAGRYLDLTTRQAPTGVPWLGDGGRRERRQGCYCRKKRYAWVPHVLEAPTSERLLYIGFGVRKARPCNTLRPHPAPIFTRLLLFLRDPRDSASR